MAKKTTKERESLKDAFWSWLPSELNAYSKAINDLLNALTDEQMEEFIRARIGNSEDEDSDS